MSARLNRKKCALVLNRAWLNDNKREREGKYQIPKSRFGIENEQKERTLCLASGNEKTCSFAFAQVSYIPGFLPRATA